MSQKSKTFKKKINQLKLISLDTEDDSKGNVRLINFYDGKNHYTFTKRQDAIAWFLDTACNWDIWTTNLQYDLINTFGEELSLLEINYVGSRTISAKLPKTKVYFKDTLNHWKISVAEMGKRIGHEKLEGDIFDENNIPTMEQLITRCKRDAEITYLFVKTMKNYYRSIGARLKATIGSTAMDFFKTHYFGETKQYIEQDDLEFLKKGYYGGRTEIFFNKPIEGNIQYYDFNSLYPSVMHKYDYPIIAAQCYKRTNNPNLNNHGVIHATVECPKDLYLPYLPLRLDNNSLIFPTGCFTGHWSFFEIREAQKLGYKITKIHEAIEFTRGNFRPFKTFVENLYEQRLEAKKKKDDLLSDSIKLIMNNLYGKFGQGNQFTKLIPLNKFKDLKPTDQLMGDMVLREEIGDYPKHTNFIWALLTTAYGRHEVYQGMKEVIKNKAMLLYCDTDSIIFESNKKIFKDNHDLGGLKSEGQFIYAYFKSLKLYKLIESNKNTIYKARGIPKKSAKEFFEHNKATFRRPYKLRECLRRNLSPKRKVKLIPNYWEEVTKESLKQYDKRQVLKNGETKPINLKELS